MVLPPKPPPISAAIALIRDGSMASTCAVASRIEKWPWLDTHRVISPFSLASAMQAWVSM